MLRFPPDRLAHLLHPLPSTCTSASAFSQSTNIHATTIDGLPFVRQAFLFLFTEDPRTAMPAEEGAHRHPVPRMCG